MTGYIAALVAEGLPMMLLASVAPRISRLAERLRGRRAVRERAEQADATAHTAWLTRLAGAGDDFPQTLTPAQGAESLADYIDRTHPETRRAA